MTNLALLIFESASQKTQLQGPI